MCHFLTMADIRCECSTKRGNHAALQVIFVDSRVCHAADVSEPLVRASCSASGGSAAAESLVDRCLFAADDLEPKTVRELSEGPSVLGGGQLHTRVIREMDAGKPKR